MDEENIEIVEHKGTEVSEDPPKELYDKTKRRHSGFSPRLDIGLDKLTNNRIKSQSELSSNDGNVKKKPTKGKVINFDNKTSSQVFDTPKIEEVHDIRDDYKEFYKAQEEYREREAPREYHKEEPRPTEYHREEPRPTEYHREEPREYHREEPRPNEYHREEARPDPSEYHREHHDYKRVDLLERPEPTYHDYEHRPEPTHHERDRDYRDLLGSKSDDDDDVSSNLTERPQYKSGWFGKPSDVVSEIIHNSPPAPVESTYNQKRVLLKKLERLRRKGYVSNRKLNSNSNIDDLQEEVASLEDDKNLDKAIESYREYLVATATGLELINKFYNPLGANLNGFSEHVYEQRNNYDDIFEELYEKYKEVGSFVPVEIRFLLMFFGSAVMFHMSKSFAKNNSKPAEFDSIMNKYPQLRQAYQHAVQTENQYEQPQQSTNLLNNLFGNNPLSGLMNMFMPQQQQAQMPQVPRPVPQQAPRPVPQMPPNRPVPQQMPPQQVPRPVPQMPPNRPVPQMPPNRPVPQQVPTQPPQQQMPQVPRPAPQPVEIRNPQSRPQLPVQVPSLPQVATQPSPRAQPMPKPTQQKEVTGPDDVDDILGTKPAPVAQQTLYDTRKTRKSSS